MTDDYIFQSLRRDIRARLNDLADSISTGGCPDYASYQRLVGKVEGLAEAERFLLDLEQKVLRDE
jgi:hypothetical protein